MAHYQPEKTINYGAVAGKLAHILCTTREIRENVYTISTLALADPVALVDLATLWANSS